MSNFGLKILVIVGPTAVGKSALAVRLARKFRGEVISADSRQVYRGLNIGAGKITKREMRGVRHHLLDAVSLKRQFSAYQYQKLAVAAIEDIQSRGRLPIICGGTGFYIQAVVDGGAFPSVPPDLALRKKLSRMSASRLFDKLRNLDKRRAASIDPHNPCRLIRAIEIALHLGAVPSIIKSNKLRRPVYKPFFIGLMLPNKELRDKIRKRLHGRIRTGMVAEVRRLHESGVSWRRFEELGLEYRYVSRYLRGEMPKEDMIITLEQKIWQYAKRQETWFRRDKRIYWYNPAEASKINMRAKVFLDP